MWMLPLYLHVNQKSDYDILWGPKGWVTHMPIVESGPKSNLYRDFMPVLVICKFDEDSIKNEVAIVGTTFSPLHVYGRLTGK